jgi:hypothetical protein
MHPEGRLHHFVSHPAKEESIGPLEVLDRVTMQVFVREHCTMIAAPVQCNVDGISKGSHYLRVPIAEGSPNIEIVRAYDGTVGIISVDANVP